MNQKEQYELQAGPEGEMRPTPCQEVSPRNRFVLDQIRENLPRQPVASATLATGWRGVALRVADCGGRMA
jgi:hypothetical protein